MQACSAVDADDDDSGDDDTDAADDDDSGDDDSGSDDDDEGSLASITAVTVGAVAAVAVVLGVSALVGVLLLARCRRQGAGKDMEAQRILTSNSSSTLSGSSSLLVDRKCSSRTADGSIAPSVPSTSASVAAQRGSISAPKLSVGEKSVPSAVAAGRMLRTSIASLANISLFGGWTRIDGAAGSGSEASSAPYSTFVWKLEDITDFNYVRMVGVVASAVQLAVWRQQLLAVVRAGSRKAALGLVASDVRGLGEGHAPLARTSQRLGAAAGGGQLRDFYIDFDSELMGRLGEKLGVGATAVVYKVGPLPQYLPQVRHATNTKWRAQ